MVESIQFTVMCDGVPETSLLPEKADATASTLVCGATCNLCPRLETIVFSFEEVQKAGRSIGLEFDRVTHLTYADFDRSVRLLAMQQNDQIRPCERTGAKRYVDGMYYKMTTTPQEETKK